MSPLLPHRPGPIKINLFFVKVFNYTFLKGIYLFMGGKWCFLLCFLILILTFY